MRRINALAIFNALSLIAQLTVAKLIQSKMINPQDTGEVAAKYENLFSPAPVTFGIWGIVYTALGLFCLYHVIIAYKHDKTHPANTILLRMNGFFIMVNLAACAWLIAWSREWLLASVGLIFLQLICLVIIHRRLRIYDPLQPAAFKMAIQFPLSIYLGWISIATIANISAYLTSVNWDGYGVASVQWTVIMITLAVLLSVIMIFAKRNIYFALTVAWGLYGIFLKRKASGDELNTPILIATLSGIGIIVLFSLVRLTKNLTLKKPREIFPVSPSPVK